MSALSGVERHPVVVALEALAADIKQRLDAIAAEDSRRREARDIAAKLFGRKDSSI